jgi:hypothetical protein
MSLLVGQIAAAEKFMKCQTDMGLASRDDACSTQVANLSNLIRKTRSISQEECTELLLYLQVDRGTFSHDARMVIAKLINGKLEVGAAVLAGDGANQSNPHFYNYCPNWLWDILLSDDTFTNKMTHTGEFLVNQLGHRHVDDPTKRLVLATIGAASKTHVPNPGEMYEKLHEFQEIIVRKRSLIAGMPTLRTFPADPTIFWAQFPTAYSNQHGPVKCKVKESTIFELNNKQCIPVRSNNAKVKKAAKKSISMKEVVENRPTVQQSDIITTMMKFMLDKHMSSPPAIAPTSAQSSHVFDGAQPLQSSITPRESHIPQNIGALPGCLMPPKMAQATLDMNKIRDNIKAATGCNKADDDADVEIPTLFFCN